MGFPEECQEMIYYDETSGERHIADVSTPGDFVVEIQHSSISFEEARSREFFYNQMIWIVDARHLAGSFFASMSSELVSCSPMMYAIQWWGQGKILERWSESTVPVYFDLHDARLEFFDHRDDKLWFLAEKEDIPVRKRTLWRLMKFDKVNRFGLLAPVAAEAVIDAVMEGEMPPLSVCDENEAWKFRREMKEVGGRIDRFGNKTPIGVPKSLGSHGRVDRYAQTPNEINDEDLPF